MRRINQELSVEECVNVLRGGKRGVLSVIGDDGYPYGIPINYFYDETTGELFFHSAKEGHKIDAIKNCDKVSFSVWNQTRKSDDGWSWYYHSVVAMGRAEFVSDFDKTVEIARKIGLKYFPSPTDVEHTINKSASKVLIIAVKVEHLSGKSVHEK
ncbi:MAG: pyridoxamine 5'-phosphate oxidase family protein [Christensenellales bacterium]